MKELLVKLELEEAQQHELRYEQLDLCLSDVGLQALFDAGDVVSCSIHCDGKKITAVPTAAMTWDRFKDQLVSNSTTILRKLSGC